MEENPILEFLKKAYVKFLDTSQFILFFVAIMLIAYMFILQPHEVSGLSMYPTFKNKDFLLSYLVDVRINNIRHGDVVVFHSPVEEDKLYIKRVIGLPKDTIKLEGGAVYRNGDKVDESEYLDDSVPTFGGSFISDGKEVTVSENTLIVMGDNRPYSSDSRAWGLLPYSELIGRSLLRFWPVSTFTLIGRDPYN
jgi:signal peptidase I